MELLTYAGLDAIAAHLEKALAEPPLKLVASGGGMAAETGSATQEIVLDHAILVPRGLCGQVLSTLKQLNLAPAPSTPRNG